jgi:hypothetical protein
MSGGRRALVEWMSLVDESLEEAGSWEQSLGGVALLEVIQRS